MYLHSCQWLVPFTLLSTLANPIYGDEAWIGQKFMPKIGCAPTINGKVVARGIVNAPLVPSKVNGNQLWVGRAWVKMDEVVPLEDAIAYYSKVLEADPSSIQALSHRGYAKELLGDPEGAVQDWNKAIRVNPHAANAYSSRARHFASSGKLDEALRDMNVALKLEPENPTYLAHRASIRIQRREWEGAFADANEALRFDPQCAAAYHHRGMVWQQFRGDWQKALADYDEAIRLDPELFASYGNRALIRATSPDERVRNGKQAISDAMRTCQATGWKIPKTVRTLAAAYAELGQFEEALKWQQKAIELAGKDEALLTEFRGQLEKYKAGKPLRLSPKM